MLKLNKISGKFLIFRGMTRNNQVVFLTEKVYSEKKKKFDFRQI